MAEDLTSGALIRRLLRDYLRGQWLLLAAAIVGMLAYSGLTASMPFLVSWFVKYIFLLHDASKLVPLSLMVLGLMLLRAAAQFFGRVTVDSLGVKTVKAAQADMFARLMRRDLADRS